jgi:hypothetical protein
MMECRQDTAINDIRIELPGATHNIITTTSEMFAWSIKVG